ncbi:MULTISPECIES: M23 family metallopeptidase [Pelosinus]|jgi:murein DD-endopeptidase MepM/ murein hydrolase activator NlpD|uniref:Peptidase M23 n=1 Tax=Pelosinus fermentans B4 TaxID=1149862 RepID=I9L9F5_9FIRM|nr:MULTISPECIES: M23 family metallopeptidase [Pelosinus]EIW17029.1 Peptidase M23 [Pelosinus fermentans B4]EIW23172.1 Peptidase M23 [Pelosinus fermentans A11]OAM93785.1 Peptidase M23 [Pelosinus fermentans DSM 17108]SDQ89991.1 Peptidase family M23 [Pelosinus fermentans]
MAKLWNKLRKNRWGETRETDYSWQYQEEEVNYNWLKKTIIAGIVFAIVYCAHISETAIGRIMDDGVRYTLTAQTDVNYVVEKIISVAPENLDLSILKRVQTTISKPADPLLYMHAPVTGKITVPFGWGVDPVLKQEKMHEGIDMEAALGTSVQAAAPGKVKMITDSAQLGKVVIIEHSQEIETVYGHLGEVLVQQGDAISQGQIIAKVGKSGMVTGPLLYFEVRENGKAIDPTTRLKGEFPKGEEK